MTRVDPGQPGTSLFLVSIADLLDLVDIRLKPPGIKSSRVAVLNGIVGAIKTPYRPSDSPRRALRAAIAANLYIKYTGVWRSMFMRVSSQLVDVVYSIMGIFGL